MSRSRQPRSDFSARLVAARNHAGLSQAVLARRIGVSQSSLATSEVSAEGSTYTASIARACGVDAYWLETGLGSMLPGADQGAPWPFRLLAREQIDALTFENRSTIESLAFILLERQPVPRNARKAAAVMARPAD